MKGVWVYRTITSNNIHMSVFFSRAFMYPIKWDRGSCFLCNNVPPCLWRTSHAIKGERDRKELEIGLDYDDGRWDRNRGRTFILNLILNSGLVSVRTIEIDKWNIRVAGIREALLGRKRREQNDHLYIIWRSILLKKQFIYSSTKLYVNNSAMEWNDCF